MTMGAKQQIKKMVPNHAWRTLQRAKANMKLKSYYSRQRKRFLNNCAGPWNSEQSERLRGTMVYYIHRIEKGLSHQHFRDGFGKSAFSELKAVMEQWRKHSYPVDDVTYQAAQNVIRAYPTEVASADKSCDSVAEAGTKTVRAADKRNNASLDYATLFAGRTSVREYEETAVDREKLHNAVAIAMKTPSVCNRQAYRILFIHNPKFIERALTSQGGWRGYSMPPVLALISVDVRSFVSVEERNEPYIDGGLFAMSFLTALELESLAACPLNTMMRANQEQEIRKLLGVPDYEVLIAFVAIGNFPESIESPVSFRYQPEFITRELN